MSKNIHNESEIIEDFIENDYENEEDAEKREALEAEANNKEEEE